MNKLLCGILPSLLFAYSAPLFAQHSAEVTIGSTDFLWKEFTTDPDNNNQERRINSESGPLTSFELAYRYSAKDQSFKASYKTQSGDVDYLGAASSAPLGTQFPSVTSYALQSLNVEYGKWFDVDYIKPYAAILGGYQARERIIAAGQNFDNRAAEDYSNYYWGALLEAELFNWNNLSLDVGGEYTQTVKGKNQSIDQGYTINLEAFRDFTLYTRINYEFWPSWRGSLILSSSQGEMEQSRDTRVPIENSAVDGAVLLKSQPKSKQELSSISLRLSKTF